jgi:hypothetical protein
VGVAAGVGVVSAKKLPTVAATFVSTISPGGGVGMAGSPQASIASIKAIKGRIRRIFFDI